MTEAWVIGAGPAGLMAAEEMARAGLKVTIADRMPSPGRKLLMAGKSGLNLTKLEDSTQFAARISQDWPGEMTPKEVISWAEELGVPLFTGSTGRVFPTALKSSPLLRAWLARLDAFGATLRLRWRWAGFDGEGLRFETPQGIQTIHTRRCVLALGGASWPQLGSDAAWVPWLREQGVEIAPFKPANMGFLVDWSARMHALAGTAVKGTEISAGNLKSRGEWVISARGVEGGGLYEIAQAIRDGAPAKVDLAPDLTVDQLSARLGGKQSVGNRLRRALGPVRAELALEWGQPLPAFPRDLATLVKALPMSLGEPMGLARAISSAGGIMRSSVTSALELRACPGIFVAGEMLDWEAPTGGYLITKCLGTGRLAGREAARS